VRTFDKDVQDTIEQAMRNIIAGVALSTSTQINLDYIRYYPATINNASCAEDALRVAATVAKAEHAPEAAFTSEDFAFMLQACEGAYIWLGQGKEGQHTPLHHPEFDFNDDVLATGIRLHCALVEDYLSKS